LYSDFSFNESIYDCYTPLYTGLEENQIQNNISLYPNPTKERVYINAYIPIKKITICNFLGQEIKNYNTSQVQSSIDISGLNEGVYFVKIYTEKVVLSKKIVVK
jgi:hypothetical protein